MLDWSIPKQDSKTIYKIGTFEFKHKYVIKTKGKTHKIDISLGHESIQLLTQDDIESFQEEIQLYPYNPSRS